MNDHKNPVKENGRPESANATLTGLTLQPSLDGGSSIGVVSFSQDISGMPEIPPRNNGHRRAHSEVLSYSEELELGPAGSLEGPSLSDENDDELFSMYFDVEKLNASGGVSEGESSRSGKQAAEGAGEGIDVKNEGGASAANERRLRHQHSQSLDCEMSIKTDILGQGVEGMSAAEAKKAASAAKLAELALVDPKKAKRIWANRQSAARSKERKMRYIAELERKVQALQTEVTTLTAQLSMMHRDTSELTAENNELKVRLQAMEQQLGLQDALNDALKAEVHRLKIATDMMSNGCSTMNFGEPAHPFGVSPQIYHQRMQMLAAQQMQQLQLRPLHQQPVDLHQPMFHQNLQAPGSKMIGRIGPPGQRSEGYSENGGD